MRAPRAWSSDARRHFPEAVFGRTPWIGLGRGSGFFLMDRHGEDLFPGKGPERGHAGRRVLRKAAPVR